VCFYVLLAPIVIYSVRLILWDLLGHTAAAVGEKDMPARKTRPRTCYGSVEELRYLLEQDQFQVYMSIVIIVVSIRAHKMQSSNSTY